MQLATYTKVILWTEWGLQNEVLSIEYVAKGQKEWKQVTTEWTLTKFENGCKEMNEKERLNNNGINWGSTNPEI